jgi:hypothetical protein
MAIKHLPVSDPSVYRTHNGVQSQNSITANALMHKIFCSHFQYILPAPLLSYPFQVVSLPEISTL